MLSFWLACRCVNSYSTLHSKSCIKFMIKKTQQDNYNNLTAITLTNQVLAALFILQTKVLTLFGLPYWKSWGTFGLCQFISPRDHLPVWMKISYESTVLFFFFAQTFQVGRRSCVTTVFYNLGLLQIRLPEVTNAWQTPASHHSQSQLPHLPPSPSTWRAQSLGWSCCGSSVWGRAAGSTWAISEAHWGCEQPWVLCRNKGRMSEGAALQMVGEFQKSENPGVEMV